MPKEGSISSPTTEQRIDESLVEAGRKKVREQAKELYVNGQLGKLYREARGAEILAEAYYLLLKELTVPKELLEDIRQSPVAQGLLYDRSLVGDLLIQCLLPAIDQFNQDPGPRSDNQWIGNESVSLLKSLGRKGQASDP